jgi:hypothetical protein
VEPYAIALLVLLASAVAAVVFTAVVVVLVDRSVHREERGAVGPAREGAGGAEPGGNDAPGAGRAGGGEG